MYVPVPRGYRLLDGHDAGDGEETCDDDGCQEQPEYVRLSTGEWVCEKHTRSTYTNHTDAELAAFMPRVVPNDDNRRTTIEGD